MVPKKSIAHPIAVLSQKKKKSVVLAKYPKTKRAAPTAKTIFVILLMS
jgi:hypothetical protein